MSTTTDNTNTTPPLLSNHFHFTHAITNITTLNPITLDIKTPNYQRWSYFCTITVGCFSLSNLLHGKPCPQNISLDDWERDDYLLQSWIYSTISDDLSSMIVSKTTSAHQFTSLASLFTDNKDYYTIQLEETFKFLKNGSLSIHDYCQTIKHTAD